MIKSKVTLVNKLGLHARAASKLMTTAATFSSQIHLAKDGQIADAKNIMSLLMLAASMGTELDLEIDGEDQDNAYAAIVDLINRRFDEDE